MTWRKIAIGASSAGIQTTGQAAMAMNGSPDHEDQERETDPCRDSHGQ